MKYYIAYGSNLSLEHMETICPSAKFLGIGMIKGYNLAFRGSYNRAYLTIIEDQNKDLKVGVYSIDQEAEKALDYYEAYPELYQKDQIPFILNNKEELGLVYIMNDEYEFNYPKAEYIEMVKKAYRHHKLDIKIIEQALLK